MSEFSIRKIINDRFHVNNNNDESGIGYYMIIDRDLMVQLGLKAQFKSRVLQWNGDTVHMTYPSVLLGNSDLNNYKIRKLVM